MIKADIPLPWRKGKNNISQIVNQSIDLRVRSSSLLKICQSPQIDVKK